MEGGRERKMDDEIADGERGSRKEEGQAYKGPGITKIVPEPYITLQETQDKINTS